MLFDDAFYIGHSSFHNYSFQYLNKHAIFKSTNKQNKNIKSLFLRKTLKAYLQFNMIARLNENQNTKPQTELWTHSVQS